MTLLERLVTIQKARGLTDSQFAELLDIPRSTWQLTRSGAMNPGLTVIKAVRRAFPELEEAILAYLAAQ